MKRTHYLSIPSVLTLALTLAVTHLAQAASYTWNVTSGNWSAPASWNPATSTTGPTSADTAIFGVNDTSSSSGTANNIVDASFARAITGLTYNSTNPSAYNVTQIGSGRTLTVTGPILVGGVDGAGQITEAYMIGGGTLVVTGTPFTVQNYGSAIGADSTAYLNLSGLSAFVYDNPSGTISIEDDPGSLTRLGGNLTLAAVSNYITANNLNLGTSISAQAGPAGTLVLGPGTNIINVASLNLANNKSDFTMSLAAKTGGLRLRGVNGGNTGANITIGNRNQDGTGTCTGTLSLNGSPVDIIASSLTVGANPNTGSTTGDSGVGIVEFDTGTLNAANIVMASSATPNGTANGTITVGAAGTLIVGAGGVSLVNQAAGCGTGTLSIVNGGTVACSGNITEETASGNGNLNVGGTLSLASNCFAGTFDLPINNISLSNNATLQFGFPTATQPNIVVNTLNWPDNDSNLTINVTALPPTLNVGDTVPFIYFVSINGTVSAPVASLPPGYGGSLSQSGNTIILTILKLPSALPTVPRIITATPGNAKVALNWSRSAGTPAPITYNIGRSTNSGEEEIIASDLSAAKYTDSNLLNGTTYYYVVEAENGDGLESVSTEVSATPVGPPPAPTGVIGTLPGSNQPLLIWTDTDADSYNVLRATTLTGSYLTIATGLTETTYTDTNTVAGFSFYYYEVVGVNDNGASPRSSPAIVPGNWNLVWSDEFNGTSINTNTWTFENGNNGGWGNSELEYYTDSPDNAYVSNGLLHIVAQQQSIGGFSYTSARMNTGIGYSTPTYGRFQWRAALPAGLGLWPALWLLGLDYGTVGWPACGEIDVAENDGSDPTFVQATLHSNAGSAASIYDFTDGDSVTNFHTYLLDWEANSIQWFVDGNLYATQASQAPFNAPFFFIMDLAVGGQYVGYPSTDQINAGAVFPAEMLVDYVRVYELTAPLQISATQSNGSMVLTWPSDIVCHLQARTNSLAGGNWSDLATITNSVVIAPNQNAASVFYRLESP